VAPFAGLSGLLWVVTEAVLAAQLIGDVRESISQVTQVSASLVCVTGGQPRQLL
jgi:hypothetical protein